MADQSVPNSSRRQFLKNTSIAGSAAAGLSIASNLSAASFVQGEESLKVGVIGCGGRGSGAVRDTLTADPTAEVVAIAEMFPEAADSALKRLQSQEFGKRIKVTPETLFVGFEAYKNLLETDCDIVILATPPGFRPLHLEACINAGKHVFCEKPVAVDPVGCRKVAEVCEMAKKKNLTVVSGLCWRYETGMRDIVGRIQDKQIGDITAVYSTRFNNGVEKRQARTPEMTEMEFQLRNWYYFTWLSADFFAEQFVHELDKVSWTLGMYPTRVLCTGGRETRTGEKNGNVFDHFSAMFEYENGLRYHATTRQQQGCTSEFQDLVYGTKGVANLMKYEIKGENSWRLRGNKNQMYLNEHKAMYEAIKSANTINNGDYMVKSSLMGIMARMSAYTGKAITWEEAMNSKLDLSPSGYTMKSDPPSKEVSVPGVTPLV